MNFLSIFQNQSASLARFAVFLCRILTGKFDPRCGIGVANTNVAWFNRKLFAMYESDLPYEIKVTPNGDLRTLGRHELFGGGPFMTMTAHPKIDQETGEVFAFRCSFIPPFLTYFRISPDGIEQPQVPIFSQKKPSLVHDFAVTENYAIFPDVQIVMNPINFLTGKAVLKADPGKVPRLGILPRDAEDEKEMWWVEVPGLNAFHIVNAWEEEGGDTVMMVAQNVLGVDHFLESMDSSYCLIEKVEIDLKSKIVKRLPISPHKLDFIVINPSYHGRKNRYIYAAVGDPSHKFIGVVKLDLTLVKAVSGDCTVATHMYELGCYGSEPYFVPRDSNNRDLEEDDGYLVSYVHNENTNVSKFIVMDAKSTTLDIVASVKLPQRVPYGFHGTFVPDCNLKKH